MSYKVLISNVSIKDLPVAAFNRSYYLARGLASIGHKVTMITNQNAKFVFPYEIEIRDGVKIVAFPSILGKKYIVYGYTLFSTFLKILYILFHKYDIVHSDLHRNTSLWPCQINRFFYRSKLVSEWWDYLGPSGQYDEKSRYWKLSIGPLDNWMEKRSKKISDSVIVLSEFLREKAIEIDINKNKIYKLWGASDINKIKYYDDPSTNRKQFDIPEDLVLLVFSGMSDSELIENLDTLKAVKTLREEGHNVSIARTGKKFTSDFLKKLNIGSELLQLGLVDYGMYDQLLSCADAFVLIQKDNNKNKGRWPNSCGDYLAAGRPIFSNSIGDLKEVESQFPEGFIVLKENGFSEAYLAIKLFIQNRHLYNQKYSEIRKFAEEKFSWEIRTKELEAIYQKTIQNN